jgi:hypothetical protein
MYENLHETGEFSLPKEPQLTEEQISNLISSFGNHEAKAITLLVMEPRHIYNQRELHQALLRLQGTNPAWQITHAVPIHYCEDSLEPIGLVTKEILDSDLNIYGYIKTEYGTGVGDPLAGLLLDISERYNVSLISLFGKTSSRAKSTEISIAQGEFEYKSRAPGSRLKIFGALVKRSEPMRVADISEDTGLDVGLIGTHLIELSQKGIIEYKSVDADKPTSFYRLSSVPPEVDPKPYKSLHSLTNEVMKILRTHSSLSFSRSELLTLLRTSLGRNPKSLDTQLSSVLTHLEKSGYLEQGKFKHEVRSEASLTADQRDLLQELTTTINLFRYQSEVLLSEGKMKAARILDDPQIVSSLLARAREASPSANSHPRIETQQRIYSILALHPNTPARRIQALLKEEDIDLSVHSINAMLRALYREGRVVVAEQKNAKYYSIRRIQDE